jgi:hypothetical protein
MTATFLNEQAQLFVVSAACFALGLYLLYLALGLYALLFDKLLRWFGVHAALTEYIYKNRKAWWNRTGIWFTKTFLDRD